jgi:CHASE3 domain sensor protein
MPSQRIILGIGLAILLAISAASIGLDLKSQYDVAVVGRALAVLKKLPDIELLLRRTESAARGFALSKDPYFISEHRNASERIPAVFDDLIAEIKDSPAEKRLLEETKALAIRRVEISS